MATFTKVTRHGQITLPAPVRRKLGIEEGDFVEIRVVNDAAILMPKRLVDKSQAYFWTRKWQEEEKEASEDIRKGRVKRFESVEDLIKELEEE